jgi:hypothetical protein
MTDADHRRITELISAQHELYAAVLAGTVTPADADPAYRPRHRELRPLLVARGRPCFCVEDSIQAWPHAYSGGTVDARAVLDELLLPFGDLFHPTEQPPWTLIYYMRAGDASNLPFADFERSLTENEFVVLDASLRTELAVRGSNVYGHIWPCGGGRPTPKVYMFKIEEGTPSLRVVLRVFYVFAPDGRIALLTGFNKGPNDKDAAEAAAARVACRMRADFEAQVEADAAAATAAVR